MKSKDKKIGKPRKTTADNDDFLRLMKNSGVKHLKKPQAGKPIPPAPLDEPIDFDDSFQWEKELDCPSTTRKFTGQKASHHPKQPKKLKITRDFTPDDILDLHGETRESALQRVQNAIRISERGNYQALLIITGKGINSREQGGVLGKTVWNWLAHHQNEHPIRFQWAPPFMGGKGAILVIF